MASRRHERRDGSATPKRVPLPARSEDLWKAPFDTANQSQTTSLTRANEMRWQPSIDALLNVYDTVLFGATSAPYGPLNQQSRRRVLPGYEGNEPRLERYSSRVIVI